MSSFSIFLSRAPPTLLALAVFQLSFLHRFSSLLLFCLPFPFCLTLPSPSSAIQDLEFGLGLWRDSRGLEHIWQEKDEPTGQSCGPLMASSSRRGTKPLASENATIPVHDSLVVNCLQVRCNPTLSRASATLYPLRPMGCKCLLFPQTEPAVESQEFCHPSDRDSHLPSLRLLNSRGLRSTSVPDSALSYDCGPPGRCNLIFNLFL